MAGFINETSQEDPPLTLTPSLSSEMGTNLDQELVLDSDNTAAFHQRSFKPQNMSEGAQKLRKWLNKAFKIEMTDGRILTGIFLCTDRDRNVILGSCSEYLPEQLDENFYEESRHLGLVMVPGKHIVSMYIKDDFSDNQMVSVDGTSLVSDKVL